MTNITYQYTNLPEVIRVQVDGKMAGFIRPEKNGPGYYFTPKDSKLRGETLPSIVAVKRSLEG
jgi:hypothetical protein